MRYISPVMTPFLLIAMACTTPPTLSSVSPADPLPGTALKILGDDFVPGASVDLVLDDVTVPLQDVEVRGTVLIEGKLPDDIASGTYTVNVKFGDQVVALVDALAVTAPEVETACGGEYTANTQLSLARKLIVVDRFYKKNKERETLRIDFSSVDQIEYELVKLEDEKFCSQIYIRTKDGKRVVFDDDTRVDLKERAYKIGSAIGKKVVVTRADADSMGKPMEEN